MAPAIGGLPAGCLVVVGSLQWWAHCTDRPMRAAGMKKQSLSTHTRLTRVVNCLSCWRVLQVLLEVAGDVAAQLPAAKARPVRVCLCHAGLVASTAQPLGEHSSLGL